VPGHGHNYHVRALLLYLISHHHYHRGYAMPEVTITGEGLATLLKDFNKKVFASIHAVTKPKLTKKGRVSGKTVPEAVGVDADKIRKVTDMVVGVGYDYQDLVLNRLINKEGKSWDDYTPGESWHIPWEGSTMVHQHKTTGEKYFFVECIANNKPKSQFVNIETGIEVSREVLEEFLPKESEPQNQGLDKPVVVRTFKLDSIKKLKVNGTTYEVVRA
jgi:hypothetical protein